MRVIFCKEFYHEEKCSKMTATKLRERQFLRNSITEFDM